MGTVCSTTTPRSLILGLEGGNLVVEGDVPDTYSSVFTIHDMISDIHGNDSTVDFQLDFAGHIDLESGIKANQEVRIGGEFQSLDSIDLNNGGVAGTLEIVRGGDGSIENGGVVSGTIMLANGSINTYSGEASFASVSSGGEIKIVNDGTYAGEMEIAGDMEGDIDLNGDVSASGVIAIGGSMGSQGRVLVGGDCSGGIDISGTFSNGGLIQVAGALTSTGEITVTGESGGDVIVGHSTASGSLIHFPGGINSTGSLTINASEGAYAAAGDITVGTLSGDAADDTNMDGNITILDDSVTFCVYTGSSAGAGDLDGTLRIAVCDDDAYDHNVCIEGDVNGTIDIDESGCEDPPGAGIACLACSS